MDQILQTRILFLRRYHSEPIIRQFLDNESRMLSIIEHQNRMNVIDRIHAHIPRNITLDIPLDFFDNIAVVPSADQLNASLLNVQHPEGTCTICQEHYASTDQVVSLRNCNHTFHRLCATAWYNRSVYCPICRNDIRNDLNEQGNQ
jgi:hypothetical protein